MPVTATTIPYEGSMPEKERQDQFFRIIRTLLGSNDPQQMDLPMENWKRSPQDLLPEFERSGYIGRTYLPNEQRYFYQLLEALAKDPVLSTVLVNEQIRHK